jgi:hypothetical protein
MIPNSENVARAIFSPKMIINGEIQPEAFRLRSTIKEEYLSVMRISIPTWIEDIKGIPQRKNRKLYGFAELNVGDVRNIRLKGIDYDVRECSLETFASHAGIFISVNGEKLIGGNLISTIVNDVEQDFLILAIQRELVELAQKGLYVV